jgi:hypothetical integral membrane protein (TIGR02206 family)
VRLFGPLHISLLIAVASIAVALPILCWRGFIPMRGARLSIGWTLAINELVWWIYRYSREGIHAANLPLQLCDLTVWLAVLGCLTVVPSLVEFAYFAGVAGAGMALLTPNLLFPWPSYAALYFFVAHGGIVIAVALLAFGGFARFRPAAVWRSFGFPLSAAIICSCAGNPLIHPCSTRWDRGPGTLPAVPRPASPSSGCCGCRRGTAAIGHKSSCPSLVSVRRLKAAADSQTE